MRKVRAGSIYFKFTALKNSSLSLETSNSLALKKKKPKLSKAHERIQLQSNPRTYFVESCLHFISRHVNT